MPRPTLTPGQKNDVHAARSDCLEAPRAKQRRARVPAMPGREPPCCALKNLYDADAGNPAVMAPRFRPVALRPRLSAGLPKMQQGQYAEEQVTKQARKTPSEDCGRLAAAAASFC